MNARDDQFRAFVAARSKALRRTACLLTGDGPGADDLLQESLLKVYLAWPRIRDLGAVEQYTRMVMARTHVSFWRRTGGRETAVPDVPDGARGRCSGDGTDVLDDRDELWRALATLGPRQRAVIVLRFYEDLTEAEIARVMNCSVGTVKGQLSRGLRGLNVRVAGARSRDEDAGNGVETRVGETR